MVSTPKSNPSCCRGLSDLPSKLIDGRVSTPKDCLFIRTKAWRRAKNFVECGNKQRGGKGERKKEWARDDRGGGN